MLKWISDMFWTDSLWLSPGIKWADVTNGPEKKVLYPETRDFYYQIPLVVGLIVLRYLLENYCFRSIGGALGITEKKKRNLQHIPLLESAYRRSALNKDVTALAKQLDMTEREVERWWRLRRNQDKVSILTKFCEHSWKSFYLVCNTSYGYYILWDKDWFWDLEKCFIGYPHQGVTNDVWWYYMMSTAYILATTVTFFRDVRHKDDVQLFVHHILTASVVCCSWQSSMYRIGAVIMPMLDIAETVLEVFKACKRTKFDLLAKLILFVFIPIWFYTRLYLFPLHIYRTSVRAPTIVGIYFAGYVLNIMLYLLQLLSIYWSLLILRVAYNSITLGNSFIVTLLLLVGALILTFKSSSCLEYYVGLNATSEVLALKYLMMGHLQLASH